MPSLVTHLDIAEHCIESAHLNKNSWFNRDNFFSGSIAPDLGYFNKKELSFTNLAHSGKSRKIIKKLFKYSRTPEEISFSLGFLSHLITDKILEKFINTEAAKIKFKPWYLLRQSKWRAKLLQDLHHTRMEWFMDLEIMNSPRGQKLFNQKIFLPSWDNNNIISNVYKNLFNIQVNYQELNKSLKFIHQLRPKVKFFTFLNGLQNINHKNYYPLEKLFYRTIKKTILFAANFTNQPVYLWSFFDPHKLNDKQKNTFNKLKYKVIRLFVKNARLKKFKTLNA